jgi:hypothetical protein
MRPSTLKETTRVSTIDYSSDPTYAYSVNQSLEYIEAKSWRLELGDVAAD